MILSWTKLNVMLDEVPKVYQVLLNHLFKYVLLSGHFSFVCNLG